MDSKETVKNHINITILLLLWKPRSSSRAKDQSSSCRRKDKTNCWGRASKGADLPPVADKKVLQKKCEREHLLLPAVKGCVEWRGQDSSFIPPVHRSYNTKVPKQCPQHPSHNNFSFQAPKVARGRGSLGLCLGLTG